MKNSTMGTRFTYMARMVSWWVLAISIACGSVANAGALRDFWIRDGDNIYSLQLIMTLDAPAWAVREVLTDYAHLDRLNPIVVKSEILPSPGPGLTRVATTFKGCVLFFCKQFQRVEDIREAGPDTLHSELVAGLGDFKSGSTDWSIRDEDTGSTVTLAANMEPDFFIPPLIGTYFVKRALRRQSFTSLDRLECLAQTTAGMRESGHCNGASHSPSQ